MLETSIKEHAIMYGIGIFIFFSIIGFLIGWFRGGNYKTKK